VQDGFTYVSDTTTAGFKQTFESIGTAATEGFSGFGARIAELTESFDGIISESGFFSQFGTDIADGFLDLSTVADSGITDFVEEMQDSTRDGLEDCLQIADFSFADFFKGFGNFISQGLEGISDAFSKLFDFSSLKAPTTSPIPTGVVSTKPVSFPGTSPIPEDILPDIAGSGIFDQFSQDFAEGFQSTLDTVTPIITEDITGLGNSLTQSFSGSFTELFSTDLFDSTIDTFSSGLEGTFDTLSGGLEGVTGALSGGLDSLLNTASSGFGSLFSGLGSLLQSGLSSLTDGIGSLFSGGGDFLGSIFSGIGSFFGFAGGGIVGGTPSKKDNVLVPMRSGEGVLTPEATDYYGGKGFIDAANDLALPDFFSGLQAASAPAQFAGVASKATGSAPKAQVTNSSDKRPLLVTVINKGPVVAPEHLKMKPSEVTDIFVNGMKHDGVFRRVINQNAQISKGGF